MNSSLVHICCARRAIKWVYDFPYDFSGNVGGYGYGVYVRATCDFLYGNRPGKAVRRPCGDRPEIVRCQCSGRAFRRFRTEIIRRSCGLRSFTVLFFQNDYLKSFYKISARPPHDARMMLLRNVYGLRAYDFFSQICHMSSLIKIVDATAPMNP